MLELFKNAAHLVDSKTRTLGRELFYYAYADSTVMAVSVAPGGPDRFDVGSPTPLFRIERSRFGSYDVSPDGQRFLFSLAEPGTHARPDHVVVNWTRLFER